MKETQAFLNSLDISKYTPPQLKRAFPTTAQDDLPPIQNRSIASVLKTGVCSRGSEDDQDAFYVADLGDVVRQYQQWKTLLPRVQPYYGSNFLISRQVQS